MNCNRIDERANRDRRAGRYEVAPPADGVTMQGLSVVDGIAIDECFDLSFAEACVAQEFHRKLADAPNDDARVSREMITDLAVD